MLSILTDLLLDLSPGQKNSQLDAIDASFQNLNLRTDLRWAAKRIRKSAHKFTQVAKSRKFHAYTVDFQLTCRLALGGQTVKNLGQLAYEQGRSEHFSWCTHE